jgi:FtsP/CotA-like multicopper oxidase with cupredoxin domain
MGAAISKVALATARGFQVIFTDAAFDQGTPVTGADGMSFFLADASQAFALPQVTFWGGRLGYVGLPGGYLGIGFDEYGNFSSLNENGSTGSGFPGRVPNTVALRGAFATGNPYLGGYTGTSGRPASLPFPLSDPSSVTRPAHPPTIRITLSPAALLTVEIDPHDGKGYRTAYRKTVAGLAGQPPLPAQVYLGFAGTTGGYGQRHQIYDLTVTPVAQPQYTFVPSRLANLAAWYDASDPTTLTQISNVVVAWRDKSGHGNDLEQARVSARPRSGSSLAGRNTIGFARGEFLGTRNSAFSTNLFSASTAFVVTDAPSEPVTQAILSSGQPPNYASPRWELLLEADGKTHFDFDNTTSGRLTTNVAYTGPAIWALGGRGSQQYMRKNGDLLASSNGPGGSVVDRHPLFVGGKMGGAGRLYFPFTGSIGEILIFNRDLTATETQSIEGYLACKWGLQNRLPENHPFRATCPGASGPAPVPTPAPRSGALPVLPELRSSNGRLAVSIVAHSDSKGNPKLYYNGSTVAPTLRVLPGDLLSVTLTNQLPAMPPGSAYVNDTNLHYHGLHVTPNAPGDDSIDMLALPGQTLNYQLAIPYNHPPGLYWYHSHAHGEVERQNLSGMSGALIVDGIAKYVPAVANMPERVLVVRDALPSGQPLPAANRTQVYAMGWAMAHATYRGAPLSVVGSRATMTMGTGTAVRSSSSRVSRNPYVTIDPYFRSFTGPSAAGDGHCTGPETAAKNWTVNGASNPTIGIRPGEKQFWRLVNAGSDTYLDVAVDNAQLQIVALDGTPLSSGLNVPASLTVNDYVVPPASRVEFIVTGPPAGKTAYLRTLCFDAGQNGPAMPATTLARIDPTTSLADNVRPRQRVAPKMVAYHFPYRMPKAVGVPVARAQTLYYSDQNTINGQAYDPAGAPQFYAQSGTVEEWTIVNNSAQVHTFHIHQIHFLVEAIDGVEQAQEFVRDNVNVPAASAGGPGTVKLLMDFTDPRVIGTFLLHCHILAHEDAGMMAKIRVGLAPPMTLSAKTLSFKNPTAPSQAVKITGGLGPYSISGCGGIADGTIAGATAEITPTGQGSCYFTIADSSGLSASVSVTVGVAAGGITVTPDSLSFVSRVAPAQSAQIAGGKPPYTASGCAGIASAAINATDNGVDVAPAGAGSCTVTISDAKAERATLAVSVNASSTSEPGDNVTFHHDAARSGWYSSETTLTTANVASASFKFLARLAAPAGMPAFGKVYAQPLYIGGEGTSDGKTHNLIIVATATDQVYAFDETSRAVVWEKNLTNPAAGITQQFAQDIGCGDVNPNIGIVGTPVIDRALDRLYVVVPTKENGSFHLRLHALSLLSGNDAVPPVEVTATVPLATGGSASVNPEYNYDRAALLEANGNVYVGLTSHCDFHSDVTHGWLLAFSSRSLALTGNLLDVTAANTGNDYYLGSVWGSGFGPAADASGNVFFATGNGPYNGVSDFSMTVLRVPGNLDVTKGSTFTPFGEAADSAGDCDLSSGGVILLPTVSGAYPRLALAGGKCGAGSAKGGSDGYLKYILNRDRLGGFSAGNAGALWNASTAGPMWGGPATFQDASGTTYVVWGGRPLNTYTLNLAPLGLSVQSHADVGCLECRDDGSQPVVSSNGTTPQTAVVWALKTPTGSGGTISLYAFDALDMSHTLFAGSAGVWTVGAGASYIGGALVSPTVAHGRVYVPTDGSVAIFGLSQ